MSLHHAITEGEPIRQRRNRLGEFAIYRLPDGSGVRVNAFCLAPEELERTVQTWDAIDAEETRGHSGG